MALLAAATLAACGDAPEEETNSGSESSSSAEPAVEDFLPCIVSDAGVHGLLEHLYGCLEVCKRRGLSDRVFLHAFTDGRDTPPKSGIDYVRTIEAIRNGGDGYQVSIRTDERAKPARPDSAAASGGLAQPSKETSV